MNQKDLLYLYVGEFEMLKALASQLPPNPVVINFGAGAGNSALALLSGRSDVFVHTIDRQREGSPFGSLQGEENLLREHGLFKPDRINQIQGDSAETGRNWKTKVDMVFVDAGHAYEECKADIEAWLPHVKPGGIMAFHDYTSPNWPGVVRAVDELMSGYEVVGRIDTLIAFKITHNERP